MALHELPPHPIPLPLRWGTAIELRRNGFFPILIVILLLISKNLSRARLRLGLRLRACQCGPAAGLNSMAVLPGPLPTPPSWGEGIARGREGYPDALPDARHQVPDLTVGELFGVVEGDEPDKFACICRALRGAARLRPCGCSGQTRCAHLR